MLRTRLNSDTYPDLLIEIPVGIIPSKSIHTLVKRANNPGSRSVVTSTPTFPNTDTVSPLSTIANTDSKLFQSRLRIKLMISATEGNLMRLSLLRSPTEPDPKADQGTQEMSWAIYPHLGTLAESDVPQVAYAFNVPMKRTSLSSDQIEMELTGSTIRICFD
jgi:hypothetical protein